jgi:O-Antigen ligase
VSALTAPAEPSLQTEPELSPDRGHGAQRPAPPHSLLRADALWWPTILVAAIICFVTFLAGGGLHLGPMTTVEIALTIGAGLIVAATVLLAPAREAHGLWSVGLLLAFTALTALSVVWSVQPDQSFKDAGRMLAYSGVFGAAVALARAVPNRWPAVLAGVTLATVVVCGYALLTKVFPSALDANDVYARLRAPYDYWNAIGLTAAMGVVCCLWLGSRRAGHAVLSALAYPAMGLVLVTLMLAYSRGALVAAAFGVALWFCIVPLRLRGAAVLIAGAVAAALVVAWDFSRPALSTEGVALGVRVTAGHQLGALLAAMLILLTLAGLAIGFFTGREAPTPRARRNAGATLLALLALAVIGFAGALAVSHRGLPGSVSHAFHALTDTHAKVPNTPGRLTAISSVRARYWDEALSVFKAHPVLGAGAEGYRTARLRYRTAPIEVRHAHGFAVQTLADLGVVGMALVLALLLAWMAAAGRATHPFNRRWASWSTLRRGRRARPGWRRISAPYSPERTGMLGMLCIVVVFGVHSLVDWTWYVPGTACVALLCAGWLAGRGPLEPQAEHDGSDVATDSGLSDADSTTLPAGAPRPQRVTDPSTDGSPRELRARLRRELTPMKIAVASAAVIATLLAAWVQWQPQSSEASSQEALSLLASNPSSANAAALTAVARDPLSVQALFTLADVQQATAHPELARATLQHAVRMQPSNPETWLHLGEYDLSAARSTAGTNAVEGGARSALLELGAAIYLNPESIAPEAIANGNQEAIAIQNDYVEAFRASTTPPSHIPTRRPAQPPRLRARP